MICNAKFHLNKKSKQNFIHVQAYHIKINNSYMKAAVSYNLALIVAYTFVKKL